MIRERRPRGFTLVELVIALAIVAAMLVVAFGGLRVAIAAWGQGEDRAETHQHLRGAAVILARAIGAAYPYRAAGGLAPQPTLLFRGTEQRLELVTQAAPLPAGVPIAFTAVVVGLETEEGPALVVRQRPLPNRDPFTEAAVALRDPTVQRIAFSYLNEDGAWQASWDAERENGLPHAVRITLSMIRAGRTDTLPPLTIALRSVITSR